MPRLWRDRLTHYPTAKPGASDRLVESLEYAQQKGQERHLGENTHYISSVIAIGECDRLTHYPTAKPGASLRLVESLEYAQQKGRERRLNAYALFYSSHPRSRPTIAYPMCDRPIDYPTAKLGASDRLV